MHFIAMERLAESILAASMIAGITATSSLAAPEQPEDTAQSRQQTRGSATNQSGQQPAPARASQASQPTQSAPTIKYMPTAQVLELLKTAYAQLTKGSIDNAVETLCAAIKLDRNSPMARRYLCYALIQRNQPREAIVQLNNLAQLNCGIPFDLCLRGQALQLLGEYEKSIEALKAAQGLDPSSDYIRDKLIDVMQISGQYKEAGELCSQGYHSSSGKAQEHYLELYNQVAASRSMTRAPEVAKIAASAQPTQIDAIYGSNFYSFGNQPPSHTTASKHNE